LKTSEVLRQLKFVNTVSSNPSALYLFYYSFYNKEM